MRQLEALLGRIAVEGRPTAADRGNRKAKMTNVIEKQEPIFSELLGVVKQN